MGHADAAAAAAGPTILVVEDEGAIRGLLELVLGRGGFRVVLAGTGVDAVAAYHRGGIDAVLLDVRMPGLDGVETARALRGIDPGVKYFFMTGDPGRYTPADLAAAGAVRVFGKPLDMADLVGTLRRVACPPDFDRDQ